MDGRSKFFLDIESAMLITAESVLKKITGYDFLYIPEKKISTNKIKYITTIGLIGIYIKPDLKEVKIHGSLTFSWEMETYLVIANKFLGTNYQEYDEEIADVGMEILNTVLGNSKPELRKSDIFLELSIPTGYLSTHMFTDLKEDTEMRSSRLNSSIGNTDIVFSCSQRE